MSSQDQLIVHGEVLGQGDPGRVSHENSLNSVTDRNSPEVVAADCRADDPGQLERRPPSVEPDPQHPRGVLPEQAVTATSDPGHERLSFRA
eukprot:8188430-Pyramimonas_sp.AAC.1